MARDYDGVEGDEEITPSSIIRGFNPDQYCSMNPTDVGGTHTSWRPNQLTALQSVSDSIFEDEREPQFLELPTGCVAGDTLVMCNRGKNGRAFEIADAYKRSLNSWTKRADVFTYTRSYKQADNFVGLNKVEKFVYSGMKTTYELTLENGFTLRATANHPILTVNGYKALGYLQKGVEVLCDTSTPNNTNSKPRYKTVSNLVHHPFSDKVKSDHFKNGISNRVPFHRLVIEAALNKLPISDFIERCKNGQIEGLVFLDPAQVAIHHKDLDFKNNVIENLATMSHEEHKRLHGSMKNYKNFGQPTYSKVVSVTLYGEEDTYDIVCADPFHNFVANGIVVHNSGKSMIATALGHNFPVLVFVESHKLLEQYHDEYSFDIVKGMASYECVLLEKITSYKERFGRTPKASECHFKEMGDCPVYDNCPYIVAREKALASKRMACTYAFGLLSMKVRQRPGVSIWDEAHLSAGIIVSLSENVFTGNFFSNYGLPLPPLAFRSGLMRPAEKIKFLDWLHKCKKVLEKPPQNLFFEETNEWVAAYERVSRIMAYFKKTEDLYYSYDAKGYAYKVRLGGRTLEKTTSRLVIKPLTAALNVPKLMGARAHTILMSATLGDPAPLAQELGFKKYSFSTYPHPIDVKYRPVYDLGFERMTWANISSRPILSKLQANVIAAWIKTLPEEWRGIVLTASYDKRNKLRDGLAQTSIKDRLFNFKPDTSVTERISEFYENADKGKIAVDISYGWSHGISFSWDKARFVVLGSVSFGEFNDPFQKVRRENVKGAEDFAWWTAFTSVPQTCGRVSRGEIQEDGTPLLNVAALADGSATTSYALKYYPAWFRESIIKE